VAELSRPARHASVSDAPESGLHEKGGVLR
jgi:hypothetical protein